MATPDTGAISPFACCTAWTAVTPDDLLDARTWALENDHDALLEHRVAVLTQASWEVQQAAEHRLVTRFLHAVGRCPQPSSRRTVTTAVTP